MANIIFMGTPDFAKESLEKLYNEGHNILGVFTATDKPKGRGMKLIPSPVKEYAVEKGIQVYQPETLKNNIEMIEKIKELKPDYICVVAYGLILPEDVINIPKKGCINVHPSLLPKYRGATPIQFAVINGDDITGVTTMYMDKGMDSGDIIMQKKVKINEDETMGELWNRLSKIGANLLDETINKIEDKTAPRIKQGDNYTVVPMLTKEMAKIDWRNKSAEQIKNLIRGLNPIMGAYTTLNEKKIKFWRAKAFSEEEFIKKYEEFNEYKYRLKNIIAGTIIYIDPKEGIYVKATKGVLLILELQVENSKKMSAPDFLRGNKIEVTENFI